MRPLLLTLLYLPLFANDVTVCQRCHPIIANEFHQSAHKKSTVNEDAAHKAVWEKHPAKAKGHYKCAKCHTPNVPKEKQMHQGLTCLSCHTITNIEEHPKANKNIYETKDKTLYSAEKGMENKKVVYKETTSWLGLVTKITGSPYHDIDYRNQDFYTGRVCMGCHSHKQNGKGFTVCQTDKKGAEDKKQNCISCHMPKVKGSATTIRESQTHAFHGFAGVRNAPKLLAKYIELSYQKSENGFTITVENRAPHNLLTHPLRMVQLRTTLKRKGKEMPLKTETFLKVIGTEGKPAMPWLATEIVKDTMIKANEKREVHFDTQLQSGDEIETTLGFYIVNPKAAQKLGLTKDKTLSSFHLLKRFYFKVK